MSLLNPHLPSKPVSTARKPACNARQEDLSGTAIQFTWRELAILGGAGLAAAAAIAFVQTPIRIPGHAILKAALPMACGMAFISKPLAGTVAGSASLFTATVLLLAGVGNLQAAAMMPLLLTGPAFDWALNRSRDTSRFAALTRFALAGLAVNLTAFIVRFGTAFWQAEGWHPLNFRTLGSVAIVSFALCGIAGGIVCGMLCRQRKLR
jgi:hypothetical protein